MPEPGGDPATLLTVAPAAIDPPHLLRIAIDAEQVGAARIHLARDQVDVEGAVAAIRSRTSLVITAEPGSDAVRLADPVRADFVERVLPDAMAAPEILREIAGIAATGSSPVASVGGRGSSALPVLLAALAAGLHVRVGTADGPSPSLGGASPSPGGPSPSPGGPRGPRDDIALIARAAGLARIAGRPAMPLARAREFLGLS